MRVLALGLKPVFLRLRLNAGLRARSSTLTPTKFFSLSDESIAPWKSGRVRDRIENCLSGLVEQGLEPVFNGDFLTRG